jgi:photosystem II stability/assembly factor-like uncharacterized protein
MSIAYQILENRIKYKFLFIFLVTVFINFISLYGSWEQINSPTGGPIQQLITNKNKIYSSASIYFQSGINISGYGAGAFVSTDDGSTWKQITKGNDNLRLITNLAADENYVYASTFLNGIYRTSDDGITWELIHKGTSESDRIFTVNNIKIINSIIYLCTSDGLYKSSDFGNNWEEKKNNIGTRNYFDLTELNDTIYIATNIGLFLFDSNLNSYDLVYKQGLNFYKTFKIESRLYVCVYNQSEPNKIFNNIYEKNNSDTLSIYKENLFKDCRILEIKQLNNNIVISTEKIDNNNYIYKIYKSIDNGTNWKEIYTNTMEYSQDLTSGLTLTETNIFVGTRYNGIFKMDYNGKNINFTNNNIFNIQVTALAFKNETMYAGTYEKGIYYSNNGGNSWQQLQSSPKETSGIFNEINKIIVNNENIYAATSHGIYKSTDEGLSWNFKKLSDYDIKDIVIENSKIYAIGNSQSPHLFISTDEGISWIDNNLTNEAIFIYSMLKDGSNIYLGTISGILKSTNEGDSWINVGPEFSLGNSILSLVKSKNNILAGSLNGIYLSGDNGDNWSQSTIGLNTDLIRSLYCVGNNIFCASDNGAFISLDNGNSWDLINTGLNNFHILGYSNNNNIIYAYLLGDALYKSNLSSFSKIEITSIPNIVICTASEFGIEYKINRGIIFNSDNTFNVQLSDASGDFNNNALTIGTVQKTTSGTIIATIPAGIPYSNKYRIRIQSTSPELIGIDNLVDLTILNKTKPEITGDLNVCEGDNKSYSIPDNPGYNFKWIVTNGVIIGEDNQKTVVIDWTKEGNGQLKIIQTNIAECNDSNFVPVQVHPIPVKPEISQVENTLISSSDKGNQWFLNGNLLPNDTNKILTPTVNGNYSVQVTNEFGCLSLHSNQFAYEDNTDFIVFEIDSAAAKPGETLFVNIRLIKNKKFYSSNVRTLSATFSCNSSLLYPLDDQKGSIIRGKRVLELDLDTNYIYENIIKVLKFEAMLGDSVGSVLTLTNIIVNGASELKTFVKNGLFSLLGVCYDGGARLITSSGNDIIKSIMPNPAEDKINVEFTTTENSKTNFYLLNTLGIIERNLFNNELPAGTHILTFSINGLSIGDHYLIMETPTSKSLYKLIISR